MNHTAELIAVGTELLLGNIANLDAQIISQGLSALGITVHYHTVVGDNPQRLADALDVARRRADIIITTGGLGPTYDDLTKQTICQAFGRELRFHPDILETIRAYFARTGRTMPENNRQQAMLPVGCTIFDNPVGTAPGCAFCEDGVHVLMLPGPPRECRYMFEHKAVPYLAFLTDGVIVSHEIRIFGMGESHVEARLREAMTTLTNPTLAPYAKEGECELRITAKAADEGAAHALIDPVEADLKVHFGPLVYGVDIPSLEAAVFALLKEKRLTLGTAESCTGGLVAKRMTDLAGVSSVFRGGVVSYATEVKHTVLGVDQDLLDQYGAVSEPVARAMAEGARKVLGCDLAISTTGVAGPDPDERGNPVGLVFIALATPEGTWVRQVHLSMGRQRIRHIAASHGFDLARRYLNGLELK